MRRARRGPRPPAASKSHRVLSGFQARLSNRCAAQGQGVGTTLGPSGSNTREASGQLLALGEEVRAKWESGCGDGTVHCEVEAPASSSENGRTQAHLPRWPPPAALKGLTGKEQKRICLSKDRGWMEQRDGWRASACIPSTLPSPLPFETLFGFTHTTWENG